MKKAKKCINIAIVNVCLTTFVHANTWTVNKTTGWGTANSLPWAINNANADATSPRIINFDLSAGSVITVPLNQQVPPITNHSIFINGWGTNGVQSAPFVTIDGVNAIDSGLWILGNSNSVQGLVLINFEDHGIQINGNGNTIQGNYIGINRNGIAQGNDGRGIYILGGNGNTIGGPSNTARNIISGNHAEGIFIFGAVSSPARGNALINNYIGTDISGGNAVPNGTSPGASQYRYGIHLDTAADTQIGQTNAGNVISGNAGVGIWIQGASSATNNSIVANYIGTDATGSNALANGDSGIVLFADKNVIGGLSPQHRNIIAGNDYNGIDINSDNNLIMNNYIGVDITGTNALPNIIDALYISGDGNSIGATNAGSGNVLCASNGKMIWIVADSNHVYRNFIGTDISQTRNLGNIAFESAIQLDGAHNVIGNASGAGNIIAHSGYHGIFLSNFSASNNLIVGNTIYSNANNGITLDFAGARNRISQNSIYNNGGLGIDLNDDGITTNDAVPDADSGPNNLQNFPVLTNAVQGSTHISGYLQSQSNAVYTIEFFADTARDASFHGEGEIYLGSTTVTSSPLGIAYFNASFAYTASTSMYITATATDANGNTSEFSHDIAVQGGSMADTDADSIPDDWELLYVGSLSTLDGTSDYDGDGATDYEEYVADTDPTDTSSHLRISSITTLNATQLVITATSCSPDRNYTWQGATTISTFNNLTTVPGQSGNMIYSTTNSLMNETFYSIKAQLP